jgi:hypothetical protein
MKHLSFSFLALCFAGTTLAQKDPKTTEVWQPVPTAVTPAATPGQPPSDAIVLSGAAAWQQNDSLKSPLKWKLENNIMTVTPGTGNIISKQKFGDCQLHIEWRTPAEVKGEGQFRGNSGIFFMGRYELQVLDNYKNTTYPNGQAGSIYKQSIPLVNACKGPGEWQTYDVIFTAPRFGANGQMIIPARITVLHNGILVQNNTTIWGNTEYIGSPTYQLHASKEAFILQDHGDLVSYRNIWVREL